jgi:4-diphosphocytidyl-2-C-methyl-D-erythritol kinase
MLTRRYQKLKKLLLKAPAKVNYRLEVLRKRPDGYHDLRMIMQRIDLCDDIEISLKDTSGVNVNCDSAVVSGGMDNIAWRAADSILSSSGLDAGVQISIIKRIPVAAGLGGGSSDAASVLMGLNELLGLGYSDEKLMEIGVKLGADVPFFIFKKTALAEGIGEKLSIVEGLPPVWIVLVNPNIHVSTAWVYQNLTLTNRPDNYKLPQFSNRVKDICTILKNDLESVTITRFPVIGEIKDALLEYGASGVLMSGSGPTVFSVFNSEEEAKHCHEEIGKVDGWASFLVRTL